MKLDKTSFADIMQELLQILRYIMRFLARLAIILVLPFAIAACGSSVPEPEIPDLSNLTAQSLVDIDRLTTGFEQGNSLSIRKAYVFFDTQCPHCGRFWRETEQATSYGKFVWIPVHLMNARSLAQGAALLQSAEPVATMTAHENSLLANNGGMKAGNDIPDDIAAAIALNTKVFEKLGAQGVPFVVGMNTKTNKIVKSTGGMQAQVLTEALGWR